MRGELAGSWQIHPGAVQLMVEGTGPMNGVVCEPVQVPTHSAALEAGSAAMRVALTNLAPMFKAACGALAKAGVRTTHGNEDPND